MLPQSVRTEPGPGKPGKTRLLIIVQNLPVPFDRRVWLECQALRAAGYQVSVVCPKGQGDPAYEVIDGVELYKYRPYAPGGSKVSFVAEYAYSFLATAWLVLKARVARPFDVIQACNPPDIFWPLALAFRAARRHALRVRPPRPVPRALPVTLPPAGRAAATRAAVRWSGDATGPPTTSSPPTSRTARSRVTRGGKRPEDVTVVRTGPDPRRAAPRRARPELRRGRRHLVAYLGVMGPQDGVDLAVRAAADIVARLGRDDIALHADRRRGLLDDLVALATELGLADTWSSPAGCRTSIVTRVLSTADVGLSPGPEEPAQRRVDDEQDDGVHGVRAAGRRVRPRGDAGLGGDAAVYVEPNDVGAYAEAIVDLLDDEPGRARRWARLGRRAGRAGARLGAPGQRLPRRLRAPARPRRARTEART